MMKRFGSRMLKYFRFDCSTRAELNAFIRIETDGQNIHCEYLVRGEACLIVTPRFNFPITPLLKDNVQIPHLCVKISYHVDHPHSGSETKASISLKC